MGIFQHVLLFVLLFVTVNNNNKHVKLPIFGNESLLYYYTEFYVGNPPKLQTLLVDTGSSLTIIPCASCLVCSSDRFAPLYNFEESFTSSKLLCVKMKIQQSSRAPICNHRCTATSEYCQFKSSYLDKSEATGTLITDEIRFGKATQHAELLDFYTATFGCINIEKHTSLLESNGIIGLAPNPKENILYKWFDQDLQRGFQFTFCLGDNGGFLQLGHGPEYQAENESPDFQIRYVSNTNFFLIKDLQEIRFGRSNLLNQTVVIFEGGVALDTGSTYTIIPLHEYLMLNTELINRCTIGKRVCSFLNEFSTMRNCFLVKFMSRSGQSLNFDAELDKMFPAFELIIKGKTFPWRASQYFKIQQQNNYGTVVCAKIKAIQKPVYILGMNWLRNRKFIVNIKEENIKIFNNYNCTYTNPHQNEVISFWSQIKTMISKIDTQYVLFGLLILFVIVVSFWKNISQCLQRAKGCISDYIKFRRERKLQEESSNDVEMQSEISQQSSHIQINRQQHRRRSNRPSGQSNQRKRGRTHKKVPPN